MIIYLQIINFRQQHKNLQMCAQTRICPHWDNELNQVKGNMSLVNKKKGKMSCIAGAMLDIIKSP